MNDTLRMQPRCRSALGCRAHPCALLVALALFGLAPRGAQAQGEAAAAPSATARVVELPGLRIDPAGRTLEIRGWFVVTSPRVALEYVLSTPEGKLHETLIATECSAEHLMLGLILLGLEPHNELEARGEPRALHAPRLEIVARWVDDEGQTRRVRLESLLYDLYARAAMPEVGWAFTGSRFVRPPGAEADRAASQRQTLAATVSGGLIALYHDPDAIADNPLLVGGDVPILVPTFGRPEIVRILAGDERYVAHPDRVPARGTAVTLTARPLEPGQARSEERRDEGR